ncbi:hypothetical protein QJQ45_011235 [Haematococcus lacustris]|nr:hypothetical protein QJQ45_011235 [Haematococcus lacustris]
MAPSQLYYSTLTPSSVVMQKVQASKHKHQWDFEFDKDGFVVCFCKRCPRGAKNDGLSVNNMTQTIKQHSPRCAAEATAGSKRRFDEDAFGPVPLEDRGLPEALLRAVRRRFGLFLLEELHEEVKELTLKEVVKLMKVIAMPCPSPAPPSPAQPSPAQPSPAQPSPAQPSPSTAPVLLNLTASHANRQEGFVICSDGWRYKYAANGTPLVNFILLKPDGGVLFIKVKDVSGKRKDAVAIKDIHLEVLEELRKELELQGGTEMNCLGFIMDNTAANMKALRLLQEAMPTIIAIGCVVHALNLLCKDLSKPDKLKALHQEVMQELMQEVMQEEAATLGTPTASVADILGDVKLASMVSGDSEAIRTELKNQQLKMHVRDVHSIRANNPTRFAGLLLMAQDMQVVMGAILGMTSSVTWEEVRSSSVNASVFDKLTSGWWKSLNMVVDLMEPIGNAIHRLEADMPYLSQVLPTWRTLVSHALTWEAKLPAGHPLAVGVVAAFKRRAEMHYDPVHAAAYVVDPAHFKAPRDGLHARPPFTNVTTKQLQDTIDTVARLSKGSTAAVRKELAALKLGKWSDDMVRDLASIQEQTRTLEDGRTIAADISVRRGFWDFTARAEYPLFSEAATRLLSMHITTAAAERNWSVWGQYYDAGRSQLGINKAELMVYINANIPKSASSVPSELVAQGIAA